MNAKYGSRNETTFRLTKALRERMRAVAKESKSANMLEWLKAKIAEDEEKYWIVQNDGTEKPGIKEVD